MPAEPWQLDFTGHCESSDGPMAWGFALLRKDTGELEPASGALLPAPGNSLELAAYMALWFGMQQVKAWRASEPQSLTAKISGRDYAGLMLRTDCQPVAAWLEANWNLEMEPSIGRRISTAHGKCVALLTGELQPYQVEHVAPGGVLLARQKCMEDFELVKQRKAG